MFVSIIKSSDACKLQTSVLKLDSKEVYAEFETPTPEIAFSIVRHVNQDIAVRQFKGTSWFEIDSNDLARITQEIAEHTIEAAAISQYKDFPLLESMGEPTTQDRASKQALMDGFKVEAGFPTIYGSPKGEIHISSVPTSIVKQNLKNVSFVETKLESIGDTAIWATLAIIDQPHINNMRQEQFDVYAREYNLTVFRADDWAWYADRFPITLMRDSSCEECSRQSFCDAGLDDQCPKSGADYKKTENVMKYTGLRVTWVEGFRAQVEQGWKSCFKRWVIREQKMLNSCGYWDGVRHVLYTQNFPLVEEMEYIMEQFDEHLLEELLAMYRMWEVM